MRRQATRRAILIGGALLMAGFLLRWYCMRAFPQLQGDARIYGEFAANWLQHGVYGFTEPARVRPSLIRLPGYPLFLAACFRLFGTGNFQLVLWVQIAVDLATCCLVSRLARRIAGPRAAYIAFGLAALCPFTAVYVAAGLTETLTLFCTSAAFYGLMRWRESTPALNRWLFLIAAALAYGILLRPDQGLLAAAILPAMLTGDTQAGGWKRRIGAITVCALLVILPLAPWTLRNWNTFHVLQPLAPRYANDPGEPNPDGFQRWFRTWGIDYASTEEIYWTFDGDPMDSRNLPGRAFDTPTQRAETEAIFDQYNRTARYSQAVDQRFAEIAAARVQAHPLAYYAGMPLARLANMLFRPRVEWLPEPLRWWQWKNAPMHFTIAVLFGAANLLLMAFAVRGGWKLRHRREVRPLLAAMAAYVALRCALLLTVDNSEPRYTIEFFPIWFVLAASQIARSATDSSLSSSASS